MSAQLSPEDAGGPVLVPGVVSLVEAQRHTLKHGDTFAMFDAHGDIGEGPNHPGGVFHQDMRFLSRLRFTMAGRLPLMLSSNVQTTNAMLNVDLTNPDLLANGKVVLAKDSFHVSRAKFLWNAACHELFVISNYASYSERLRIALDYGTDFADLFEVRGHTRMRRGILHSKMAAPNVVLYTYTGLDGLTRRSRLCFDPLPTYISPQRAEFEMVFEPRDRRTIGLTLQCEVGESATAGDARFFSAIRKARREVTQTLARGAHVHSSNDVFNEIVQRSTADLAMLCTETPQGPYPYAGIPWFSTPFGRDGLITAIEMLWVDPQLARGVLHFLAEHQATEIDAKADSEPGKILHETRKCELARLGEVPFGCYYGSIDSTPLFVVLAGLYWQRSGDLATLQTIWPNICAALHWIDRYGDSDGDGFIEYGRKCETGLRNQGWKDAEDSVFHADGRLAQGPIALCEVQGYVYLARKLAAQAARALGENNFAAQLETSAETLRLRFETHFWVESMGFYALALDGNKEQCRVRTSNAGQVLFSGIAAPERAAKVAETLFGRDFFSGWGIRTVSTREARYNPTSYHNGSIWPHDNAIIALGLSRYGRMTDVLRLGVSLFDTATQMERRRLPELFCGFPRKRHNAPTLYPVACSPQAWAACAPFALLQSCLGLEIDASAQVVRLRRPQLPQFLEWITIRGLEVGGSRLDLMLRRHGSSVAVNLLEREGNAQVEVLM
ncbi:MAG TPA: amylo-alpha-1,6-glucosidase [Burkholderiales bacterium]|jgi:glycogen debranching enzyme|nr:amylo-alpha-1,6-glucosidase [Burkholderiales bacterium]